MGQLTPENVRAEMLLGFERIVEEFDALHERVENLEAVTRQTIALLKELAREAASAPPRPSVDPHSSESSESSE